MKEFPEGYHGKKPETLGTLTSRELEALARTPRGRILHAFVMSLPQGARVLDVGCGNGKTIGRMRAWRPDLSVHGLDLGDLRDYLPREVGFTRGSAEELATLFPQASFDAVVCQHLIEHLLYPTQLIEGIQSILKPGGKLLLETPNWTRAYVPFLDIWFWNDYTHVRPFSKFSFHRLFNESGFRIISLHTCVSNQWFPKRSKARAVRAEGQPTLLQGSYRRSVFGRAVNRILKPLIPDILIGIAQKP